VLADLEVILFQVKVLQVLKERLVNLDVVT
jgi:hypothetical protein